MAIVVKELFRGRSGDKLNGREILYLVSDNPGVDLDETDALDAATAASPLTVDGLVRTNATISAHSAYNWMKIAVQYGELGFTGVSAAPAGTIGFEFNYQAESDHIYLSLGTRGYSIAGQTAWDFKGAINVRKVDGNNVVEGLDLPAGNPTHTFPYTVLTSSLDSAYQNLVISLMGTVHAGPNQFFGTNIGEVRFVQCNSQEVTGGKSVIRFGFDYKPNLSNIQLANNTITVSQLGGHELLWGYFDDEVVQPNPNNQGVVKFPRFVYAEKVFRDGNLNQLFGLP